jgi:methyltransferase
MVSTRGYLALLGVLALERLRELGRSRRNARRLLERGAVESGRGHYPAMVALHALLFPSCIAERLLRRPRPSRARTVLALAGLAGAHLLRRWVVRSLGDRWTTRVLVLPGAPLVTRGPYRWLRHPNYVAVATEMACIPLAGGCSISALGFSLANALVLSVRIRVEERALGGARA